MTVKEELAEEERTVQYVLTLTPYEYAARTKSMSERELRLEAIKLRLALKTEKDISKVFENTLREYKQATHDLLLMQECIQNQPERNNIETLKEREAEVKDWLMFN